MQSTIVNLEHNEINTNKGRPRATLYEICRKQLWPRPTFETTEERSRYVLAFDLLPLSPAVLLWKSAKVLTEKSGIIECTGDVRADKKSSCDSAAILMLYRLRELGKLIIRES
ncbi:endoribonuclease Dicer-like protein 3-like [Gossypium australe]|uniref:Endoribonuclease Dicer-like protein 3-like n=1 Tax=Gossypium australe TaxID=47621 RepID=A0A5B6WZU1_9ROSI|nr:endoribonuclease Dicer-like protein 3-like [Gossypium australe]